MNKNTTVKRTLGVILVAVGLGLGSISAGQAAPVGGPPGPSATPTPGCATPAPSPTGAPVIFVAAHPDDETLAMAVPLAEHAGQDVTVLILTSGGASGAIHLVNDELAPESDPLTVEEFMAAREGEATRAVSALSCPDTIKLRFAHLADGQLTTASAKAAILAVADELTSGPVRLKGHSYISAVEPHSDHRAVGNAIMALGVEQPARFSDRRFYVLPHSWGYTGSLPGKAWDYPGTAEVTTRAHMAANAYCTWAPPASYNIGCLSVPGLFATFNASPKALLHQ